MLRDFLYALDRIALQFGLLNSFLLFFLVYIYIYIRYLICRWYAHHRTSMHFLHCLPSRVSILTYLRTKAWTRPSAFVKSSTSRHRKSWETSGHRRTWVWASHIELGVGWVSCLWPRTVQICPELRRSWRTFEVSPLDFSKRWTLTSRVSLSFCSTQKRETWLRNWLSDMPTRHLTCPFDSSRGAWEHQDGMKNAGFWFVWSAPKKKTVDIVGWRWTKCEQEWWYAVLSVLFAPACCPPNWIPCSSSGSKKASAGVVGCNGRRFASAGSSAIVLAKAASWKPFSSGQKSGTGRISTSLQINITPKETVYSVFSSFFSIKQHVQPACVQFQGFMNAAHASSVYRSRIASHKGNLHVNHVMCSRPPAAKALGNLWKPLEKRTPKILNSLNLLFQ